MGKLLLLNALLGLSGGKLVRMGLTYCGLPLHWHKKRVVNVAFNGKFYKFIHTFANRTNEKQLLNVD